MNNYGDKLFGFTYKGVKQGSNPTKIDYLKIIDVLNKRGTVLDYRYEKDSKGKLHIHGIVKFTRTPLFRSLHFPYYSQKYEEIYDMAGWERYIGKSSRTVYESEQLADEHYCEQFYLFGRDGQDIDLNI